MLFEKPSGFFLSLKNVIFNKIFNPQEVNWCCNEENVQHTNWIQRKGDKEIASAGAGETSSRFDEGKTLISP